MFLRFRFQYLQPIILKIWNPWGKVEDKTVEKNPPDNASTMKCPFTGGEKSSEAVKSSNDSDDKTIPLSKDEHVKSD